MSIGSIDINDFRKFQSKMLEAKDLKRCPEASFLNNDKIQSYKCLSEALNDIITVKKKGRPIGSKNFVKVKQ